MAFIIAENMTPGKTYVGTADGPSRLDGVAFTPTAIVSFNAVCGGVPHDLKIDEPGECIEYDALLQVEYDAWAWPLPECCTFAPGDMVREMD